MAQKNEIPGIDVRPLIDEHGFVVPYDLWLAGKWVGSRRTIEQCEAWLTYLCETKIEAVAGTPW